MVIYPDIYKQLFQENVITIVLSWLLTARSPKKNTLSHYHLVLNKLAVSRRDQMAP
ncbi:hypothetical protein OK016_24985 [Vibrio chagasii]|nr:hypothetical protein [Vibrio chagasii]